MTNQAEAFDAIGPATVTVRLGEADILVRPLTVGQIPAMMRALDGLDLSRGVSHRELPGLLALHGEKIFDAVAVAVKVPRAQIESADLDQFLELVVTVLEVNRDFFVRRVLPQTAENLRRALEAYAAAAAKASGNGAGKTSSIS